MPTTGDPITVYLPKGMAAALKRAAGKERRPVSSYVLQIIFDRLGETELPGLKEAATAEEIAQLLASYNRAFPAATPLPQTAHRPKRRRPDQGAA